MEAGEAPQLRGGRRRARIEVFSAVLEDPDLRKFRYKDVFGVLLLRSCNHNFAIFDSPVVEPQQINPQGHLTLIGPERSIPVEDEVLILPWFIILFICGMNKSQHVLWKAGKDNNHNMDRLVCEKVKCSLNVDLHVSFAVYRDPVEAHLDVYFMDLEYGEEDALIQVDGTVTASNSLLQDSKAMSVLFQKLSGEYVSLKPGKSVPLPLSRRMTVIPHRSTLRVHVNLKVRMGHGNPSPLEDRMEFNPSPDNAEDFINLPSLGGKLLVKVTWVECGV